LPISGVVAERRIGWCEARSSAAIGVASNTRVIKVSD